MSARRGCWLLAALGLAGAVAAAEPPPPAGATSAEAVAEPDETPPESATGPDLPSAELPGRLELHRPNYVMPLTWTDDAEGDEDAELKFQISLKHQVGSFPVYLGYTQTAYLRWLDEENSRPFREINFNPEIWYRVTPGRLPGERFDWLGVDAGYEHESNGEDVPESRSWDRLYVRPWLEQGRWRAALKLWYRLPEQEKDSPTDPEGDDNPEILEYYGSHELKVGYSFDGGDWAEVTTRYAFPHDRGAIRLRYATPTPTRNSYFFVELFSGYGESLQTFRDSRSRIGIGFALLR
jgi:phospholipase A1